MTEKQGRDAADDAFARSAARHGAMGSASAGGSIEDISGDPDNPDVKRGENEASQGTDYGTPLGTGALAPDRNEGLQSAGIPGPDGGGFGADSTPTPGSAGRYAAQDDRGPANPGTGERTGQAATDSQGGPPSGEGGTTL